MCARLYQCSKSLVVYRGGRTVDVSEKKLTCSLYGLPYGTWLEAKNPDELFVKKFVPKIFGSDRPSYRDGYSGRDKHLFLRLALLYGSQLEAKASIEDKNSIGDKKTCIRWFVSDWFFVSDWLQYGNVYSIWGEKSSCSWLALLYGGLSEEKNLIENKKLELNFSSPNEFPFQIDLNMINLPWTKQKGFLFTLGITLWKSVRSKKFNPRQQIKAEFFVFDRIFCLELTFIW